MATIAMAQSNQNGMKTSARRKMSVVSTAPTQFLSMLDFGPVELASCLARAAELKAARASGRPHEKPLEGLHVALLFEKPSLRTRSTFHIAVRELGGDTIEPPEDAALGGRESIADVARNLERWVAAAVVRTYAQERLEAFASAAPRLRVVNALTDEEHPCQALADCLTLTERLGTLRGKTIAFVGDGNNVAASLAQGAIMLGATVKIASPQGYELSPAIQASVGECAARGGGRLELTDDPAIAAQGADAVYTDVWTSMGQEAEADGRRKIFAPYQVNGALMATARAGALFMHCLPAHRGDEVTDDVMDSPASVVFDQAENRLHTQKALLAMLAEKR
jgi:ornithine carbamoyltransferase